MHDVNDVHTMTIPSADNEAYRVIERNNSLNIVTSENAAYEAVATLSGLVSEQNIYEFV